MTHQLPPNPARRPALSLLLGALIGSATICAVPVAGAAPSGNPKETVRYELTGSGVAAYITYQTDHGQLHATNVALPWSMQISRSIGLTNLLSAQGAGPGSISCAIKIDGKVVGQNTATGDPARVFCENH